MCKSMDKRVCIHIVCVHIYVCKSMDQRVCNSVYSSVRNSLELLIQRDALCCSVLQCVAVCCSVLQCVAVCCSVL